MKYNYYENMKDDIKNYIEENYENDELLDYDELYDEMFIADSVTGNGSGSYTFNTWKAEENISHNIDGVKFEDGAEAIDVTIRCYFLGSVLQDVLEELRGEE